MPVLVCLGLGAMLMTYLGLTNLILAGPEDRSKRFERFWSGWAVMFAVLTLLMPLVSWIWGLDALGCTYSSPRC